MPRLTRRDGADLLCEAMIGPLVAEALVKAVGAGKLLVAGHFDEPAAALQESSFGSVDQGSSDPASTQSTCNDQHREPADRSWPMSTGVTSQVRQPTTPASSATIGASPRSQRIGTPCGAIFSRRVDAQLLHQVCNRRGVAQYSFTNDQDRFPGCGLLALPFAVRADVPQWSRFHIVDYDLHFFVDFEWKSLYEWLSSLNEGASPETVLKTERGLASRGCGS
jgi:hypothetical protein